MLKVILHLVSDQEFQLDELHKYCTAIVLVCKYSSAKPDDTGCLVSSASFDLTTPKYRPHTHTFAFRICFMKSQLQRWQFQLILLTKLMFKWPSTFKLISKQSQPSSIVSQQMAVHVYMRREANSDLRDAMWHCCVYSASCASCICDFW